MSNNFSQNTQPEPPVQPQGLAVLTKSIWIFIKSKVFWRLVMISSLITLFVLFGLGIACYFIVLGFLMALLRISIIYLPAGQLIGAIIGLPKGKYIFEPITGPLWRKILVSWPVIFWLGMAGLGIWLLLKNGFLAQNLIYALFFK